MKKKLYDLQLFAAETVASLSTDLEHAISIDFTSRLSQNIRELRDLLGVTNLIPMSAGTDIKFYKWTVEELASQVGEGEVITPTKVKRALGQTITLDLDKYRRVTTAEAIQKVGRTIAVNESDDQLIKKPPNAFQTARKDGFFVFYDHAAGKGTHMPPRPHFMRPFAVLAPILREIAALDHA